MGKTQENLLKAIAGESMARNKYTYFAEIAMKEGLVWAAKMFESSSYAKASTAAKALADKSADKEKEIEWKRLNCGYIHKGKSAPTKCPLCQKPQGWYMPFGVVR